MTNQEQEYLRWYDRSIELTALKKHRKLDKSERDELAHVCELMFLAQMAAWHEEQAKRQHMPMIVNGTGRIH